jgi:hypothetical protein
MSKKAKRTDYAKFDTAFQNVSAYHLSLNGEAFGRVVLRHGNAITCYFHVWGLPMVDARATGWGYDKASAAVDGAIEQFARLIAEEEKDASTTGAHVISEFGEIFRRIIQSAAQPEGRDWTFRLSQAGLTVQHVI